MLCDGDEKTSSSVVAERPRDALCPSIFSLNSVIPYRCHSCFEFNTAYNAVQLKAALLFSA